MSATPREVFESFVRFTLEGDIAARIALYADDCVLEMPFAPGGPRRFEGPALKAMLAAGTQTPLAYTKAERLTIHDTADREVVIAELALRGHHKTTGRAFVLPFVMVVRVRDGLIVSSRDYSDPIASAEALGLSFEQVMQRIAAGSTGG